jgi:hypothetical protein
LYFSPALRVLHALNPMKAGAMSGVERAIWHRREAAPILRPSGTPPIDAPTFEALKGMP